MVLDWFEKDNFRRTVQEVLIVALKERSMDFYELGPVVQTTLLGEAMQEKSRISLAFGVLSRDRWKRRCVKLYGIAATAIVQGWSRADSRRPRAFRGDAQRQAAVRDPGAGQYRRTAAQPPGSPKLNGLAR